MLSQCLEQANAWRVEGLEKCVVRNVAFSRDVAKEEEWRTAQATSHQIANHQTVGLEMLRELHSNVETIMMSSPKTLLDTMRATLEMLKNIEKQVDNMEAKMARVDETLQAYVVCRVEDDAHS